MRRQRALQPSYLEYLGRWVLAATIALLALLASPAFANGAILVSTTDDELNSDGDCSLREALFAANFDQRVDGCPAGSGADTVVLPAGRYQLVLPGMYEDDGAWGDLDIRSSLVLRGSSAEHTVIDASNIDRAIDVHFGATVTISGLTVRQGAEQILGAESEPIFGQGGALRNSGTLSVLDSRLSDNLARMGGGVANFGNLTLSRVQISENQAYAGWGGGVYNTGVLWVNSSQIVSNSAGASGAGLYSAGWATINRSLIASNTLRRDSESPSGAAGLASSGDLRMNASTISGNIAYGGGVGGLVSFGASELRDSTIARNEAARPDGTGGVLALGSVVLHGNLLAGNRTASGPSDCNGTLLVSGPNLIQEPCPLDGNVDARLIGVDPLLGSLEANGGPTLSIALRPGSPAIDAGGTACDTGDQRGTLRPQGAACDLGAFEVVDRTRDSFTRRDGPLSPAWSGDGRDGYSLRSNEAAIGVGGPVYWIRDRFEPAQEAAITLRATSAEGGSYALLLKVRRSRLNVSWREGAIRVVYEAARAELRVETYERGRDWQVVARQLALLSDGDVFSAQALADGSVKVYRNGLAVLSADTTTTNGDFFVGARGYIGLWCEGATGARLDDFAGGSLP